MAQAAQRRRRGIRGGEVSKFARILKKHDWVWAQTARWNLKTRLEVCKRLWQAAIDCAEDSNG